MIDCEKIKSKLENEFHLSFSVTYSNKHENYIIRLKESNKELFQILVEIKNEIRLNIIAKPDEYGMEFLSLINQSNQKQRQNFCDQWNKIENKLILNINDVVETKDTFINNKKKWTKFELKFSKVPYYEDMNNSDNEALKYISLISGMILALFDYSVMGYVEGNIHEEKVTRYERNPLNRKLCIYLKGCKCCICGFDFEEKYGEIGKEFIEVHHEIMVSSMGDNYKVDITKELFPVCPNCHAMLHRKTPPYTIDEMKEIVKKNEK